MNSRKYKKRHRRSFLLSLAVGALILVLASYLFVVNKKPIAQVASGVTSKTILATPPAKDLNRGLPVRLLIPKIKIDAPVVYLGLTTGGDMAVPGSAEDVGWYKYGPLPGNDGSSVVDGHVVGSRGQRGVFADLNQLQKGDNLSVIDGQGRTATFTVRESQSYDPQADATAVFRSSDGKAHLNLITCSGDWDAAQHRYLERLVVFADKE